MTIKIEIEAHPDRGDMRQQVEQAMSALGYYPVSHRGRVILDQQPVEQAAETYVEPVEQTEPEATAEAPNPARERGKPAPGRARRTKAEIAEDEAADAADAAKAVDEGKPQISTGEERVGPQDDPETAAQDAADEAAETAGKTLPPIERLRAAVGEYRKKHGVPASVALFQPGGLVGKGMAELTDEEIEDAIVAIEGSDGGEVDEETAVPAATRDDLMAAMMRYAAKFDKTQKPAEMVHTQGDIASIFTALFGPDVTKLSQVPADGYGKAVQAVDEAIRTNRFGR